MQLAQDFINWRSLGVYGLWHRTFDKCSMLLTMAFNSLSPTNETLIPTHHLHLRSAANARKLSWQEGLRMAITKE